MRIGHGYDVHRLTEGRKLILGGVDIPYEKGLLGHSDADVLAHAIMDSILGALALGDIGKLFPDNDPDYEGRQYEAHGKSHKRYDRKRLENRQYRLHHLRTEAEACPIYHLHAGAYSRSLRLRYFTNIS